MQIAFIGLGNMGGPMAINLHKAGHSVKAFDLSQDALAKVKAEGLQVAASAQDAVQGAEAVITMLPASQHVEGLFLGNGNLLASIAKGTLVIDSSTIAAATSQKVAKAAEAAGIDFIDAPVSGGTGGAIAGTLTFMVGGSEAQLERARPLLEKMGANIFHAGSVGAGQTAKICNNMLLGILMVGTSEAIALGVANGLDPKVLSEIMRPAPAATGRWKSTTPSPACTKTHPPARATPAASAPTSCSRTWASRRKTPSPPRPAPRWAAWPAPSTPRTALRGTAGKTSPASSRCCRRRAKPQMGKPD